MGPSISGIAGFKPTEAAPLQRTGLTEYVNELERRESNDQ
jgi:hypothetical protein